MIAHNIVAVGMFGEHHIRSLRIELYTHFIPEPTERR